MTTLTAIHPLPINPGDISLEERLDDAIGQYEDYRFTSHHLRAERYLIDMLRQLDRPWAYRYGWRYRVRHGELVRERFTLGDHAEGWYESLITPRSAAFVDQDEVETVFGFMGEEVGVGA